MVEKPKPYQRKADPYDDTRKVHPFEYPDKRVDDWQGGPPQKEVSVTTNNETIIKIQTLTDDQYRRLTGSQPEVESKVIRVMSPVFTTQPQLSFDRRDIRDANAPTIRILEGGRGTPESVTPFVNPFTSSNSNSKSSLLEEGKADTRGHSLSNSTTPVYDQLKLKMGNMQLKIGDEVLDILLPVDAVNEEIRVAVAEGKKKSKESGGSGVKVSIGGVPGVLAVNSKENGVWNEGRKIGETRRLRMVSHWDGTDEKI